MLLLLVLSLKIAILKRFNCASTIKCWYKKKAFVI
uniref:Uncharacterized protein n=1 Tax=Anguilla anguilla TaxID=7936 RepID=A0A0E9VX56_ANGAN